MQDIINGGVYAVDLHGTEAYEFQGVHPALIVRTLKEEKMYMVVPLTTYTKEKWIKCKRKGFGTRIVSTNSIARIDKINVVSEKQIQGRYYNSGKMVLPLRDEVENVLKRIEEYIVLTNKKSDKEYCKYYAQRTEFEENMNLLLGLKKFEDIDYCVTINDTISFEYPCSRLSFMSNSDIKDIINQKISCSDLSIRKVEDQMNVTIKTGKDTLLTFVKEYDKFVEQKGSSNT